MSFIEVRNKKGTADKVPPPGYSSWLDFWAKKQILNATVCEVSECKGKPDVGGHVIKVGEGNTEYILPMCSSCNNKAEDEVLRAWEDDLIAVATNT
jgi:hypothetical protein